MSSFAPAASDAAPPASSLYRAVWRWHFYAGLLVLPFLILLAVTGGLYLFKDEINGLIYRNYLTVAPADKAPLAASELIAKATGAVPGDPVRYVPAATAASSVEVGVATADRGTVSVYVDPYDGRVLGSIADSAKLMPILKKIHSLEYFGWVPNRIIEIVAGWAIVLVITGVYLWWPRRRRGGVWAPRLKPGGRVLWRDLHAVTGLYIGVLILFMAATGMPWSGFWGAKLNSFIASNGLGYPPEFWESVPKSQLPMGHEMHQVNWSLENEPMPASTETGATSIGIDKALGTFAGLGLAKGYVVDLPSGPEGVYSASLFPDQAENERVIHLDQYSGKPLFDGGFYELGAGAQAIEWGISVHQGQEFGRANQLVMAATCVAIVLMAVSAVVMWWKRRPKGSLGAPRIPENYKIAKGVLVIAAAIGILFPLVGASLLAMLAIDRLLPARWREKLA
ncbi:PepSY-associated TM helix domain-containing protein [Hypericibacter terrae]|nr:PepSY domain-containing protein [Hypericibacter terrae]